ncbi:MAG TPA: serpin family protein [Frankiaceae bacterium]|nr:serpin family protein [Frankiaceae bacterium]
MTRRRLAGLALAGVTALTALSGCASSTGAAAPVRSPDPDRGAQLVGTVQPVKLGSISAADIGSAQTAFGLDLLARRCTAAPTANDVLSPASASLALSMLDTGAVGSTRAAVNKLLHLPSWSPQLIAALHDEHQALTTLKQLKVSNRLYSQLGITPKQQVLDDLATAEGAGLQLLNFAREPGQATDAINQHVDADTKALIKKLFDTPLPSNTTTVLTNAIYLDAAWAAPFNPASDATFRTASGSNVSVPLMSSQEDFGQYRTSGGWSSVTLPYTGGKLEAVVLMPSGPTAAPCAAVTPQQLTALTTGTSSQITVQMPKLDLSQTSHLTDELAALGLPLSGDYSGFGSSGVVSDVVQKTVLQVDERGTKAAAATGIAMAASAHSPFTVDRPYLLLIRDTATGTPLFLARISDPTAVS